MSIKVVITEQELFKLIAEAIKRNGINGVKFSNVKVNTLRESRDWSRDTSYELELSTDSNDW